MRRLVALTTVAVLAAACGGANRAANPLSPDSTPDLPEGRFVISGTVLEAAEDGEQPAAHARIDASRGADRRTARTDESGRYTLDGVSAGDWILTVVKPGFATALARIRVRGNTSADFALDRVEARERSGLARGRASERSVDLLCAA
jgi:hypothetical protein